MRAEAILKTLNAALRQGDFDALGRLAQALEAAELPPDRAELRALARLGGETALALTAAAQGVRAAQRRLADLRRGPVLSTYDARGMRVERAAPAGSGGQRI